MRPDRGWVVSLRAAGLGDLLTAVPALRGVQAAFPDDHHVLATTSGLEQVAMLIGGFSLVIPTAIGDIAPPFSHVDVAVNLHGCGPQSHRLLLASGPGRLVAYGRPDLGVPGPSWDPDEHEVARWCRLLKEAGIPADADDLDLTVPDGPTPASARGATVLHPGAGAASRRWPIERWIAVAAAEAADGHRVVVTVGPDETALGAAIATALPSVVVIDCADDVGRLLRTIDAAALLVVGDTGVAHVATAVRTPSV